MKKAKAYQTGSELPHAKDFKLLKLLTKEQRELIEAFHEAMQALKKEEEKYSKRTIQFFRVGINLWEVLEQRKLF